MRSPGRLLRTLLLLFLCGAALFVSRSPGAATPSATAWTPGLAGPPSGPSQLKIYVRANGPYRIGGLELRRAGLSLSDIDPRNLRLTNKGAEVGLSVIGEGDGVFSDADYIEFYGQTPNSEYTRDSVYWLTLCATAQPRMLTRNGAPISAPIAGSFIHTARCERDTFYWQAVPDGEGRDHWFWGGPIAYGTTDPSSRDFSFDVYDLQAGEVSVTATMHGRTAHVARPDHRTELSIDGTSIDTTSWDGATEARHHAALAAPSPIVDGSNTLTLRALPVSGVGSHSLHLNWFEVAYRRGYRARNDAIAFQAPSVGRWRFRLTNFSQPDIEVFDITEPDNPVRITGGVVDAVSGRYRMTFEDSATAASRYVAVAATGRLGPASLAKYAPSAALRSTVNGADYILITDTSLASPARTLVEHRKSRGLRAAVVMTADIYDQFGGGYPTPRALKDFLAYAYAEWTPARPLYVTLLGDATYDPKDNMNSGEANVVTTHFVETTGLGQTPTDNWLVDVVGDDRIPEMYVGRLPAKNSAEAAAMIDKIIAYENAVASGWNQSVLLAADDDMPEFEAANDEIADGLPSGYTASKAYLRQLGTAGTSAAISSGLNSGALLTNYNGHGAVDSWAGERVFTSGGVSSLNSPGRLSFVSTLNCLNGFFVNIHEGQDSAHPLPLAEALIKAPGKGAVGVWSPTGLGLPVEYNSLGRRFFDLALTQDVGSLGAIATRAKVEAYLAGEATVDNLDTMTLFGDPATDLATPRYTTGRRMPVVSSNTHPVPNRWYSSNDVSLAWTEPLSATGISAYAYALDRSTETVPQGSQETAIRTCSYAGLSDGVWYFHVRGRDAEGLRRETGHYPIMIDTVAPTGAVSVPLMVSSVSRTTVFQVGRDGNDPLPSSGIRSYGVQYRAVPQTEYMDWRDFSVAGRAPFWGKAGSTYEMRTRVEDGAANIGYSSVKRAIVPYDNNSLIHSIKGFRGHYRHRWAPYYLGTIRYSARRGERICYRAHGSRFTLVSTRASSRSKARIYLDGRYVRTIDAYSRRTRYRQAVYTVTWPRAGWHRLTVVNLGTRGRSRFDVDALAVER